MTREEIKAEIKNIIKAIAPDEDVSVLTDTGVIREQLSLDSMDFLDIMMELRKRHKIQVPEADYRHFTTLESSVSYLAPHLESAA
jgi:acyl carrier protein